MKYIIILGSMLFILIILSLCKASGDADSKIESIMKRNDNEDNKIN